MNANEILRSQDLPEYVSGSIGRPDLSSIANRIREMAALLSAQECDEAAAHLTQAYGSLLGLMAAKGGGSASGKVA